MEERTTIPNLTNANLAFTNLMDANLAGANLTGANLDTANLDGANLDDANLRNANLARANLIEAKLGGANLGHANLGGANLLGADLSGADLRNANLRAANLTEANLARAYLRVANLTNANLSGANLGDANLSGADLTGANLDAATLTGANLDGANLTFSRLSETLLANVDLRQTAGLDACHHRGPSILDHRTLLRSGKSLPEGFLRGCGLRDGLIAYFPSLLSAGSIQFYSCFISYATANENFAQRLHADLQANGVRCWFVPHDMQGGKTIHEQIDEAIRVYERLLLLLSHESMTSPWVRREIKKARQKELAQERRVLFPLALVPFVDIRAWTLLDADSGEDLAEIIREFYVPDFSTWKMDHDAYQREFKRLLDALKSEH